MLLTGRVRILVLFILAAAWPTDGRAFCVTNGGTAALHAESLSPSGFVADVPPGGRTCCTASGCVKDGRAVLLIVTGYVPVAEGRPGWVAECRATVDPTSTVTVTGDKHRIACEVGG